MLSSKKYKYVICHALPPDLIMWIKPCKWDDIVKHFIWAVVHIWSHGNKNWRKRFRGKLVRVSYVFYSTVSMLIRNNVHIMAADTLPSCVTSSRAICIIRLKFYWCICVHWAAFICCIDRLVHIVGNAIHSPKLQKLIISNLLASQ